MIRQIALNQAVPTRTACFWMCELDLWDVNEDCRGMLGVSRQSYDEGSYMSEGICSLAGGGLSGDEEIVVFLATLGEQIFTVEEFFCRYHRVGVGNFLFIDAQTSLLRHLTRFPF